MKIRAVLSLIAIAILSTALILYSRSVDTSATRTDSPYLPEHTESRVPVLVELFTSEGCSSCPPADRLLENLDTSQPVPGAEIIALSEHVDYWNRLGWVDPFSSKEFSDRQSEYARVFNLDSIYTPQMVVDGESELVGNNATRARSAIAAAARKPKAKVSISLAQKTDRFDIVPVKIRIENLPSVTPGETIDVYIAVAESGLQSAVTRGENSGRRLGHTSVVRSLEVVGSAEAGNSFESEVRLDRSWNRDRVRIVAFIQERGSRRVVGAAAARVADKTVVSGGS
jgi:hypothetical protein